MNEHTTEAHRSIGYANNGEVDENTARLIAAQNATTYAILALVETLTKADPPPEPPTTIRHMQGRSA